MKEFTAQSNPEECADKMLSHVEAAREQVMQQFDELTQNIRSSIPRLNETKDAVNNRKCPESAPHPASTACLSCPGAGRAGRIDQLRRDVELAKTQQEQQSLIASYMSKLGGCVRSAVLSSRRSSPALFSLLFLMRSLFAQHGSLLPERAPGHHSVIVATAPLLCPPPPRGAELDGASGSRGCGHGCGVFCDGSADGPASADLRTAELSIRNSPPFYSTFVAASQLGLWNCAQPRIRSGISLSSLASIVSPSSIDIVGTVSLHSTQSSLSLDALHGKLERWGADQVACMDLRAMRFQWRMLQSMHMYRLPLASAHTTHHTLGSTPLAQIKCPGRGAHRQRRHGPRL